MEINETPVDFNVTVEERAKPPPDDTQEAQPPPPERETVITTADPRGDPEEESEIKISEDTTMEFSSSIADLTAPTPSAQAAPQMVAAAPEEPKQQPAAKGGLLGNLTPEQTQAVVVALSALVAHLEPVQTRLRSAIGKDNGMGWLAASSLLAGLVFIVIKRSKILQ